MTVPIKGKSTATIPQMRNIPEHQVTIELIEGVASIKQSTAKSRVSSIPGVAVILSFPRVSDSLTTAVGVKRMQCSCNRIYGGMAIHRILIPGILSPSS
jgi:hypothetical protein